MSPLIPPSGAPEAVPSAVPAEEPKPLISADTAALAAALPDPPIALPALSDSAPSSAGAVAEAAAAAVAASPPPPPVAGADAVGAAGGGGGTPATDAGMGATTPATAVTSIAPLGGVPATTTPAPTGGDETQFATHAVLIQQQQQIHSLEVQLASSQAEIARLRRIARGGPAAMPSFGTPAVGGPLVGVGGAAAMGFPIGAASPATGLPPEPAPPRPVLVGVPAGVPLGGGASSIAASAAPSSGALSLPGAPPTGDLRPVGVRGPAASSSSLLVSSTLSLPSATGGLSLSAPSPLQPPAGVPPPQATVAAASRPGPTTAAVPGGSAAVTPASGGAAAATTAAPAAPPTAAATPASGGAAAGGAKKGGTSRYWTAEEHARFLDGLRQFGAKDIKGIARHVGSRSATQVRTHQQKYNLRLLREKEKANSAGGGSAGAAAAGTGGAAGAASSSSAPLPGAHGGGSHTGGNTASSAGAAGARRAGTAAAANASASTMAAPAASAASAGKDVKPSVGLSPGAAAGRGTAQAAAAGSGVVAPPGARYAGISPPGAAARAAGAIGQATTTAAAAAAALATDKRPGGVMARKGQSPKRSRAGKRARSSSAPVAHTPAGGARPGAAGASASQELPVRSGSAVVAAALGMTPTGAGLVATPNGGPAAPASPKETAVPSAAGELVVRDEAAASGEVGADGGVKVHGGGDNLGGVGAVGGLDETQAELLLGGRPPLRRSGSSSVLLSELPFLQRPLVSSSGFALPRTGTGAISSTAGPAGVGVAGGAGAAGSSSGAAAAAGTAAGLASTTVRRSNSVLSLLSGMPTLRGLAESPSSERLLGLVPPELNDVDGSHVYRNGGPALSMAGAGVGGSSGGLGFGIGVAPSSDHAPYVIGSFDHLAGLSAVEDLEEPQAVAMQLQDAKWS